MKTIDIHTHLMSRAVSFDRLFDRVTIRFFAKGLGVDAEKLKKDPYGTYVEAMAASIRNSRHVDKACLFGVDYRFNEKGEITDQDRTVCASNDDVLDVASRYPDQFIPFFSLNPRRQGALELIDHYVEQGFKGAKFLQNYWALNCSDESLLPYYEKLAQHDIPLIIHVGSEYSIDSDARYERTDMLELPLSAGVKVIAAHMGLGRVNYKWRFWRNFSKNPQYFDEDYYLLLEMLQRHDNLYADISAILAPLRARALRHLSEQVDVHDKILFGTDYPVPFTIGWNSYDLDTETRKRIGEESNPFDRYTQAMLEYFPIGSPIYSNYHKVMWGLGG